MTNNNSVFSLLESSQRPMTSKEVELMLKGKKNTTSVFKEFNSLKKRDMLIRIEIKIPKCQMIVLYQLKKGSV